MVVFVTMGASGDKRSESTAPEAGVGAVTDASEPIINEFRPSVSLCVSEVAGAEPLSFLRRSSSACRSAASRSESEDSGRDACPSAALSAVVGAPGFDGLVWADEKGVREREAKALTRSAIIVGTEALFLI